VLVTDLPEFDNPPVVEVAIGVQFRPVPGLRGLSLAPLQAVWRDMYPVTEEQPPLVPVIEGDREGAGQLQLSLLSVPVVRQWFLSKSGNELVQVQPDRLLVNWRAGEPAEKYPRYRHMRSVFESSFTDLATFVSGQGSGDLDVVQAELSYINVIQLSRDDLGRIEIFLKGWSGSPEHHLDPPEEARVTLTYLVPGVGIPPVRLYAEVSPAQLRSGERVLFFTLTVRGNPGGRGLEEALKFLDEAHSHLVRSFAELTQETMHARWGRRA
jgi:uncharacterized protein (TIGR04255 family)